MPINLRICLIFFSIILGLIILVLVSKRKLPIKYSLFWLFAAIIIFLVGLVPNFINIFTSLIGFQTTASLIVGVMLVIVLFITLLLTLIISEQKQRIKLLIQEISLLKEKVNNIEKSN